MKLCRLKGCLAVSLLVLLGIGCAGPAATRKQIERVAKDWCMVIRGSQVMPVYPLTEDLFPGDVFLFTKNREEETALYETKGFLPLGHHLHRLHPYGYSEFYGGVFGVGTNSNIPALWSFPPSEQNLSNSVALMPQAAFPSYSFQIKRGGGFNLGLPIQGVPVALNFLGSAQAQGNILLKDAHSYGLSEDTLLEDAADWIADNPDILRLYTPKPGKTCYLRVINRVFLVQKVNVTLTADSSTGIAGTAGAEKDVAVKSLSNTNAAANYSAVLNALNASVSNAAVPGGSLKFASASSRAVSMDESFSRPIVIGYIGFDLPIGSDGTDPVVGPFIASGDRNGRVPDAPKAALWDPDKRTRIIGEWLKTAPGNREALVQFLKENGYPYGKITAYFESGARFNSLRTRFIRSPLFKNGVEPK